MVRTPEPDAGGGQPILDDAFVAGAAQHEPAADERDPAGPHRGRAPSGLVSRAPPGGRPVAVADPREPGGRRSPAPAPTSPASVDRVEPRRRPGGGGGVERTRTARARRESLGYGHDQASYARHRAGRGRATGRERRAHQAPGPAGARAQRDRALTTLHGHPARDVCTGGLRPLPTDPRGHQRPHRRRRADGLVRAALARASHFSGLRFVVDGTTAERPTDERLSYQPARYPGQWAPALDRLVRPAPRHPTWPVPWPAWVGARRSRTARRRST